MRRWLAGAVISLLSAGCAGYLAREADRPYTGGLAQVESVDAIAYSSGPSQAYVRLRVEGQLPDPCTRIDRVERHWLGSHLEVTIHTRRESGVVCVQQIQPFRRTVMVDMSGASPGSYTASVNGVDVWFTIWRDPSRWDSGGRDGLF